MITSKAAVGQFPWRALAFAAVTTIYVVAAAAALMAAQSQSGEIQVLIPVGIAFLPICAYLALRYPLIFPFGLLVALVPVDALLATSGGATLVRLLAILVCSTLILRMLIERRACVPHASWYWWAAVIAYATLSATWSPDIEQSSSVIGSMVMLFLMMTAIAFYRPAAMEFKVAMAIFVPAGLGVGIYSLHQYHASDVSSATRLALSAGTEHALDPNYLAGAFLPSFALALVGSFYVRNVFVKIFSALSMLVMTGAVFATGSRSAAFAVLVMFVFFAIRSRQYFGIVAILAGCIAMIPLYPQAFARLFDGTLANASGRTDIWQTGMHTFRDHWLFGSGAGSYAYNYDHNFFQVFQHEFAGWSRPGHSLIFVGLNDFGVIGLALVLGAWFVSFRQLRVIPRSSPLFSIRLGCEAAILGLFIHMLFIDPFYIKYVWLMHSVSLLVLNRFAPRELRVGRRTLRPFAAFRPAQPIRGA